MGQLQAAASELVLWPCESSEWFLVMRAWLMNADASHGARFVFLERFIRGVEKLAQWWGLRAAGEVSDIRKG